MTLLFLLVALLSRPNEVRQFTHINDNNFVKTEIIILHSQKVMFIPDQHGITQRWQFQDFGHNTYRITAEEKEGIISFTRTGAIMRVGEESIIFSNKRLKVILNGSP